MNSKECAAGNLLNFETTMAHFTAMFPDLSARLIESVLRKHDGDVGQTIEELLERSAGQTSSTTKAQCQRQNGATEGNVGEEDDEIAALKRAANRQRNDGQNNVEGNDGRGVGETARNCHQNQPQPSSSSTSCGNNSRRDPCADDEKIALLIQNREFLRYLRHDHHFRQAMIGQHQASAMARNAHRWPLPPGPAMPQLLAVSRAARSPNTRRLFHRQSEGGGKKERRHAERRELPEPVPDGPIVGFADRDPALAIPQGPLIDYVDADSHQHEAACSSSSTGWAGRLKAKLATKTVGRAPDDAEPIPPSPLVHFSDAEMQKGIQGMLARGGRGFLEGLASKFSARKQRINGGNGGNGQMERLGENGEEEGRNEEEQNWKR